MLLSNLPEEPQKTNIAYETTPDSSFIGFESCHTAGLFDTPVSYKLYNYINSAGPPIVDATKKTPI